MNFGANNPEAIYGNRDHDSIRLDLDEMFGRCLLLFLHDMPGWGGWELLRRVSVTAGVPDVAAHHKTRSVLSIVHEVHQSRYSNGLGRCCQGYVFSERAALRARINKRMGDFIVRS